MILSREQAATNEFITTSRILGDMLIHDDAPEIAAAYRSFIYGLNAYGQQELFARQAERADTLNRYTHKQKHADKISQSYRERGELSIGYALDEVEKRLARGVSDTLELDDDQKEIFENVTEDLFFHISELELKPLDMTKLSNVFQEVIREARLGGEKGLLTFMRNKLEELRYVRNQPNRGAVDNIPFWKIVAIAVAVGFAIWLVVRCIIALANKRPCHFWVSFGQSVVIVIATLLALYC